MEIKIQGRRKRGRPKRRWLDKVTDDIKEKGLYRGVCHHTSTSHKSWNKMKRRKKVEVNIYQPQRFQGKRWKSNIYLVYANLRSFSCHMGWRWW